MAIGRSSIIPEGHVQDLELLSSCFCPLSLCVMAVSLLRIAWSLLVVVGRFRLQPCIILEKLFRGFKVGCVGCSDEPPLVELGSVVVVVNSVLNVPNDLNWKSRVGVRDIGGLWTCLVASLALLIDVVSTTSLGGFVFTNEAILTEFIRSSSSWWMLKAEEGRLG